MSRENRLGPVERKSRAVVEKYHGKPVGLSVAEMIIVIETLRNGREVLTDKNYKVNREILRANFGVESQRKPLGKAQAMFYKALSDAR